MNEPTPDGTPWGAIIVLALIGLLILIVIVKECLGHTPPARRGGGSAGWPFDGGDGDGGD